MDEMTLKQMVYIIHEGKKIDDDFFRGFVSAIRSVQSAYPQHFYELEHILHETLNLEDCGIYKAIRPDQ